MKKDKKVNNSNEKVKNYKIPLVISIIINIALATIVLLATCTHYFDAPMYMHSIEYLCQEVFKKAEKEGNFDVYKEYWGGQCKDFLSEEELQKLE